MYLVHASRRIRRGSSPRCWLLPVFLLGRRQNVEVAPVGLRDCSLECDAGGLRKHFAGPNILHLEACCRRRRSKNFREWQRHLLVRSRAAIDERNGVSPAGQRRMPRLQIAGMTQLDAKVTRSAVCHTADRVIIGYRRARGEAYRRTSLASNSNVVHP